MLRPSLTWLVLAHLLSVVRSLAVTQPHVWPPVSCSRPLISRAAAQCALTSGGGGLSPVPQPLQPLPSKAVRFGESSRSPISAGMGTSPSKKGKSVMSPAVHANLEILMG